VSQEQLELLFSLADDPARLRVLGSVGELRRIVGVPASIEVHGPLAELLADRVLGSEAISVVDGALVIELGAVNHAERPETVLPLSRGHADLSVSGKLSLEVKRDGSTITTSLWVAPLEGPGGPAKIAIGVDLIMLEDATVPIAVRLPGTREITGVEALIPGLRRLRQRLAIFELELRERTRLLEFRLTAAAAADPREAMPRFCWPQASEIVTKIADLQLPELDGPLFEDLGAALTNAKLIGADARLTVDEDGVTVSGLKLQLDGPRGPLSLIGGELRLDSRLRLRGRFGVSFELSDLVDLSPESESANFSLILHGGHRYALTLEGGRYRLAVEHRERAQTPAASVYVPQLDTKAREQIADSPSYDGEGVRDRFVLDVLPVADAPAIEIGPGGVRLTARARRRSIALGELEQVTVVDGELLLHDGRWTLAIEASAALPWLRGAAGRVRVRGGSGVVGGIAFEAGFQVALGSAWTDPSGCLILRDPSVSVSIGWQRPNWSVKGALSGSLEFGRAELDGPASEWVGEIFRGLTIDFDGLSLSDLANLHGGNGSIRLGLARGFSCRLWEIMQFDLRGLKLHGDGLGFDGDVGFALGPVRLGGRLPDLRLKLSGGKVELDTGKFALAISGALELPGGVRARLDVRRKQQDGVTILEGRGSLTVPSLPDAEVLIQIGRFGDPGRAKQPTIAIYGEVAAVIHVLPGVVLRRLGVGLGIYRSLRGTAELVRSSGEQLLESLADGAPLSPGSGDDWRLDPACFLTLVARATASATAGPEDEIDYYVADLLLTIDSNLRFAGWMNAWMLSSIDDTRKDDAIRRHPHGRGAFAFDSRVPSIVAAYRTLKDGRSSLTRRAGGLASAITCLVANSQTQMLFEARPNLLHLRLGPHSYRQSLAQLGTIEASSTLAVRVERSGAVATIATRWAARLGGSFEGRIGPVAFGVGASAGFELDLTLGGGLRKSAFAVYGRGRARAWFQVQAWARISIQIAFRVKLGPFKVGFRVRIETRDVRLSLGVEATVELEVALGSEGVGASATAVVGISIAGITATGKIGPIAFNDSALKHGRALAMQVNKGIEP